MTTMDNTLPAAPRHRIRWLQRLAVAGSVGAVLLLLALVWQMLPAWLDPATNGPQHTVAVGTCASEFIAEWRKLKPVERESDIERHRLDQLMEKCSSRLPDLLAAHLMKIDETAKKYTQVRALLGVTEAFSTQEFFEKVRAAKEGDEFRAPSGCFTDRLYPVDSALVLVERYRLRDDSCVSEVSDPVPAAVRQEQWLLSALALGLVALVGISLRWLGRSQRDYQHTLQEAVLKLENEVQARRAAVEFRLDMEESISVGMRVIDHEGQITHVNRAFCETSGLSLDTLIGMRAPYLFWPDDPNQVNDLDGHLRKILDGEAGLGSYRALYVRPDGTRWNAQVSARRLGSGEGWILASTDVTNEVEDQRRIESLNEQLSKEITDHKAAALKLGKEAQARRADAEFRRDIEESISVGLRVIDREGQLIHVNRAFCETSGLSLDTLIGMRAPYLFWPDDPDQVKKLDERLRKILDGEEERGHYDATYVRPDGTRWEAQVSARRLGSGEGWIFTSTDVTREVEDQRRIESLNEQLSREITDHKVAALKLQKEVQARQEAVEFRLDIEESISVGLRVIDREGRLTHVNRAFCETSGWTAQALMVSGAAGQPQYPFWPTDQAPQLAEHLHEILAGNARPESYRVPFVRPDGTRWTAQVSARALGSGEGWILASTDVTSEDEAQRRIESLNEDLRHQSAVELIGEHSGELLHKLSNQIGAAQLALGGVAKNLQEGRHGGLDTGVQIAVAAVNQLSKTVEHFGGPVLRGEIAQEPSLLHATVTDAMVQVSVYAATHNVVMYNGISKELPPITMNRTYLREVLSNLLHNAISVMDTTPITNRLISVENYLDEAAGQVQIHVRDRGPGIEPAQREAVFERHYSKRPGGSGWGLYLCRRWVHRLGGRLEVTDNHPRGADFVITLHLTPTEEALVHDEPTKPVA